jgi:AcrR family transcriptional regulator
MAEEMDRKARERASRRVSMLKAAERLFAERGFERVSMDEVAVKAEFSKPTLYQYFANKEELLFEVAANILEENPLEIEAASPGGKSALERLRAFALGFYAAISSRPSSSAIMDLAMGLRSRTRGRGGSSRPDGEGGLASLDRRLGALYLRFVGAIEEGKADGSIRKDIEPEGAAFAVFFLMRGFLGLVSEPGTDEGEPPGAPRLARDRLARYALELVLEGIRARP